VDPIQSWCETDAESCIEQTDENEGSGWVFCDPKQAGKPTLPYCTCQTSWKHTEGICANKKGGNTMFGCPSIEQMRICEPDYDDSEHSWCITNEKECLQQENWHNPDLDSSLTMMVGEQWSYCSPITQSATLPPCTCIDDEAGWTPLDSECPRSSGAQPSFIGCPSIDALKSQCGDEYAHVHQSFCHTYEARCDDQSMVNDDAYNDMTALGLKSQVGQHWAFCDDQSGSAEPPKCECKHQWFHDEQKCAESEMEFSQCPSIGEMRRCEFDVSDSWCETTYSYCREQPSDAWDFGWAFCDSATAEPKLAPCQCKERWTSTKGATGECTLDTPKQFRGCPALDQLGKCDGPALEATYCETTQLECFEQSAAESGTGFVQCDSYTQTAVDSHIQKSVGAAIGITFMLTVIFCVATFIGFLLAYRRYINRHKRGYSQELLEHN